MASEADKKKNLQLRQYALLFGREIPKRFQPMEMENLDEEREAEEEQEEVGEREQDVLAETEAFKIVLRADRFKKSSRHQLGDHLYTAKIIFKESGRGEILVRSLMPALEKSISALISDLQERYKDTHKFNIVYLTIVDNSLY